MTKPCNCWREGNTLPRGAPPKPVTVETLQHALDLRDELIFEQEVYIRTLKHRINNLEQKLKGKEK